jgi:hypothetical protein
MMMMETPKLRKFWALAKKAISKNEKVIRRWLWERYGVWSPHDLKYDDQEAVLAKLEEMANHGDEKIPQASQLHGRAIFTRAQWGVPRSSHQVRPLMRINS